MLIFISEIVNPVFLFASNQVGQRNINILDRRGIKECEGFEYLFRKTDFFFLALVFNPNSCFY
jgi:hypothetical protein